MISYFDKATIIHYLSQSTKYQFIRCHKLPSLLYDAHGHTQTGFNGLLLSEPALTEVTNLHKRVEMARVRVTV